MGSGASDVCIIGGGPAGLMAAIEAAKQNVSTVLLERGPKVGRKLLLTGGGRCNLTHAGTIEHFIKACWPAGNSLKPAFYTLSPDALITFFADSGMHVAAEANGCIFPKTGGAAQVAKILAEQAKATRVQILCEHQVVAIQRRQKEFLIQTGRGDFTSKAIIVATGGLSYPQTGSTGDGLTWAKELGHAIIKPIGILCPIVCSQRWLSLLQGISLDQVCIQVKSGNKAVVCRGSVVFTANGLGGPAAFDVSRVSADSIRNGQPADAVIDLCGQLSKEELQAQWLKTCADHPRKEVISVLMNYVPKRLGELMAGMAGLEPDTQAGRLQRQDRKRLLGLLKQIPITITGHAPIEKATVTGGGAARKDVNFKTMQSRMCPGLFLAGEVLDADGPCGGYNLQIAFSTGAMAGQSAAAYVRSTSP